MRKRKLFAWVLAAVMAFSAIGSNSITALADTTEEAGSGTTGSTDEIQILKEGIDIWQYDGKLEGEWCQSTTDSFGSYNIAIGSEEVDGETIDYVDYTNQEWANAKWKVYIRQAGTYKVTARMKVSASGMMQFTIGQNMTDELGNAVYFTPAVSSEYVDVAIGTVELDYTGLYGIKLMDCENAGWTSGHVGAKIDSMTLECTNPVGEWDDGTGVVVDPTDETVKESNGGVISQDAVEVYMTSTEKSSNGVWWDGPVEMANQMTQKDSLDLTAIDDQNMTTINVNPDKEYQEFLGLGTSVEESSVYNILQMDEEKQDEFLRMLVDPEQVGMTLFRVTIGTADFTSRPFYTYYDAKELTEENALVVDGELVPDWYNETGKGFSIQKDIDFGIIGVVQKILELAEEYGVEDEVRIFGSSWTPPGWMKSETGASKSYKNNELLLKGGDLVDEYIDDLAMYYTRFLEEYAKLGIDLYAITLQNEPLLEIDYPSCHMTGEQEGKLAIAIKEAVNASTVLTDEQKQVKLWAFDHNPSEAYDYVEEILSVEGANEALDGIAFHDYSGSLTTLQKVLDELLNQGERKDQTVNLTERSVWGTAGANSIITYLRNSAISYNAWVTMLDSNHNYHQWTGDPGVTMFVRAADNTTDYWATPEVYMTGQFSRFIRPGFVRVDSDLGSEKTITNVVFKNPETNELVAVVVNQSARKQDFKFVVDGTQFIGTAPAGNIVTFVWDQPENIHYDVESGFSAVEYSTASEGVVAADDYVTTSSADDYIDYVVDVKEAGTYAVILEQQPSADDQKIGIYQGDALLREVVATKTWNSAKVNVRGTVTFDKPGIQQIRIKMSEGVQLYNISLIETVDVHTVPGKFMADEYDVIVDDNGNLKGATVNAAHQLGDLAWWTTIKYKVNVPADGTYAITMSSATENMNDSGYIIIVDDTEVQNVVSAGMNWGNNIPYEPSGSWTTFTESGADIALTEGEHTIAFKIANSINIEWISIGSYVDVEAAEIGEGSEDGKTLGITVTGGTIADEEIKVVGLPEGVDFTAVKDSDSTATVTLKGNSAVDFDEDVEVAVNVPVVQPDDSVLVNEVAFTVTAVNDEETLVKPAAVDPVELKGTVVVPVKIEGGTFNENVVEEINVTGDALLNYSVANVALADNKTVNITFTYDEIIYKPVDLTVEVPATAYDDSTGNATISTNVSFNGQAELPTAIEPDEKGVITLTEDLAYASNGSLAKGAQKGTYVDYFINVPETADYTVVYTFNTSTSNGTSYSGAWNLNRGVPGTIGTNSYKAVDIPALWTSDTVKIRQKIELVEGKQTFEIAAGTSGYSIAKIEIVPVVAQAISTTEATKLASGTYIGYAETAVVLGENIEYTKKGTAFDYVIHTEKAGKYSIGVNYAIESSANVSIEFAQMVGDEATKLGSVAIPSTGAWGTYKDSTPVEIVLPKGDTTLRLTLLENGANIKSITITPVELDDDTPEPTPVENPFGDVKESDWYYKYAKFAYDNKLMSGKGNTDDGKIKFDPANNMTRAEFVQMLYAKEGKPAVEFQNIFTDVKSTDWFSSAVIWANQNEIVKGAGEVFNVSGNITRQEMAAILYKYAVYKEYDVTGAADITGFVDDETVAEWAVPGMKWAVQYGVVSGKEADDGMALAPNGTAIRAEAATMMRSFMVAYEGVAK